MIYRRLAIALAVFATALLPACGGSGGSATPVQGAGPSVAPTSSLLTVDVDGDQRPDLIELDRADAREPTCRQATGDGAFRVRADWADHPVVRAVRSDARTKDDNTLRANDGIHRARGVVRGATETPYAVLHIGPPEEAPDGPPAIVEIQPTEGDVGTWVAIRGSNFVERDDEGTRIPTSVTFGGVDAEVFFASARFILTAIPTGAALGAVDVVVTRGENGDALSSTAAPFTVLATAAPVIESVHPTPLVTDALAYVRGNDLGTPLNDVAVTLGGETVSRFLALGRRLVFEVPTTATGGPLVITVNGIASADFAVTVADDFPTPAITGLTPGNASPGSLVQIDGTNLFVLGDRAQVFFGGVRAALFGIAHDQLVAIVPPAATSGDVTVQVGDRTSAGSAFTVVARGAPTLTSLDPLEGEPGTRVDLRGTDLYDLSAWTPDRLPPFRDPFGGVTVSFGASTSFFFTPTTDGLRAVVPFRAAAGVVDVSVQVGATTSNALPFTVK